MALLEMTVKECLNNIVKQYASQTALIENQSKKALNYNKK
ncbi:hypothetical protein BN1805_01385 [Proteus vulgaris]|nr:hypothetical protein BN1805_01385 [Proteus vulgaris]